MRASLATRYPPDPVSAAPHRMSLRALTPQKIVNPVSQSRSRWRRASISSSNISRRP